MKYYEINSDLLLKKNMPSEEFKENVQNTFKESLLILVYEFMGTALMTILFINTSKCPAYSPEAI